MNQLSLGSDNHSGVHPELLKEMIEANHGFAASYEQDETSKKLKKLLLEKFNAVDAALVFNGTAANVISLQVAMKSYEAVLCTDCSHLNVDECGAPEKIAGVKVVAMPSKNGKFDIEHLENAIIRKGDQHFSQVKVISVTQPTEYGTVYSKEELQQIKDICLKHNLYLHIDGARYANALVSLSWNFHELAQYADVISFGGAKNGLMMGEFVIVRNPEIKEGLKFFRKQSLQLPAKTRFLTAPFIKYINTDLWKDIASHENRMAQHLRQGLENFAEIEITQETQANSVFCIIPKDIIKELRKDFFFYVWDEMTFECRLMTSYSITEEHINQFLQRLKDLLQERNLS